MDGITNVNQLTIVKEYKFDNPPIQKIDSLIDISLTHCHYVCEYNINFYK